MNWGYRLAALYISFVVMMLLLVSMAVKQDFDLVSDDYYRQEIEYQNRIDKINNTQKLKEPLSFQMDDESKLLHVNFPKSINTPSGKILLYRPTDSKKDVLLDIAADADNKQSIDIAHLQKGLWRVKIDWNANETAYYNEEVIVIN
jgi:hypothetical protein